MEVGDTGIQCDKFGRGGANLIEPIKQFLEMFKKRKRFKQNMLAIF